jgi:hypothetical protein
MKNFRIFLQEALETKCQTPDAMYHTKIDGKTVSISVDLPFEIDPKDSKLLEANIHNAMELVLRGYFDKKKSK